ncbi:MAG: hypothetical protein HY938_00845 [Nitrosomonadales bacterium]|nr:hypothetical protein [Nitrosomonadales bacterium]
MNFVSSPTEMTTSVTDAVLVIECMVITASLWRLSGKDRWRQALWCWVFGLMTLSSLLGAIAHGFELSDFTRAVLWKPLYLSLGVLVALFMVCAANDWQGRIFAQRLAPWAIAVGAAFYGITELSGGAFAVFVAYEAAVMLSALAIYFYLAVARRLNGAGVIAAAIVVNLVAAGIQASSAYIWIIFPFDHNGIFHLVQMAGTAMLGLGVHLSMRSNVG